MEEGDVVILSGAGLTIFSVAGVSRFSGTINAAADTGGIIVLGSLMVSLAGSFHPPTKVGG